jgi:hypothetical protein
MLHSRWPIWKSDIAFCFFIRWKAWREYYIILYYIAQSITI